MKELIEKLEKEIKETQEISEKVTWKNTDEDNFLTEIEDFLISHNAGLEILLEDLKKSLPLCGGK